VSRIDVALVGVVVPGVENHSLTVLGDALGDAGFAHSRIPFLGFAGMREMIADVLRVQPRICGISLQTTEAVLAVVVFAKLLRGAGFAGTIVVGGHLASLAPDELLATGAFDVVVQLAGEAALVGLARGLHPRDLPGTLTAAARGAPPLPVRVQAMRRARLGEHLGFGAADLLVSRGCPAHCGYCCVSTVSDVAERTGGTRHIVRDVEPIAEEIAEVAAAGGRAFHFMDDNVLPLDPSAALAWTRGLTAALAARRVPRIAFSLQLRADVVTPELADALVEVGLVRAYVGIDGYTPGQLRAIGRSAPASAGVHAIELLASRGVFCVANALIVGPTIGFDTIVREIDGLAAIRRAPVHLLPIEARPGTIYHRRASARGLIEGGPLWPIYRFEDERTFFVGEMITKLPTRLVERSVPIALYDLAWALGVARRLAPEVNITAACETYARVTEAWNADQVRVLRAACAAAERGGAAGKTAIDALLAAELPVVRVHDDRLLRACDDALIDVERAVSALHRRGVRAHARGRLLGGVAIAMGLAACSPDARPAVDAAMHDAATDAAIDALPACADPAKTSRPWSQDETCQCAGQAYASVQITLDADGGLVAVRQADGSPLPSDIEQCILGLLATYCYPTLAGETLIVTTCHSWIA
jgi:hypothetical protein